MSGNVLAVCGWCPKGERVTVLNPAAFRGLWLGLRFDRDGVLYDAISTEATTRTGFQQLQISHGICDTCKALHFPAKQQTTESQQVTP